VDNVSGWSAKHRSRENVAPNRIAANSSARSGLREFSDDFGQALAKLDVKSNEIIFTFIIAFLSPSKNRNHEIIVPWPLSTA